MFENNATRNFVKKATCITIFGHILVKILMIMKYATKYFLLKLTEEVFLDTYRLKPSYLLTTQQRFFKNGHFISHHLIRADEKPYLWRVCNEELCKMSNLNKQCRKQTSENCHVFWKNFRREITAQCADKSNAYSICCTFIILLQFLITHTCCTFYSLL